MERMEIQQPGNRLQQVNVHSLMEKFKSKKEIYNFLTQDCKAYLPRLDSTNIYFLKQIIQGKKEVKFSFQYIKRTDVNVASVPQIDGLTVQDFLDHAKNKQNIKIYLPDEEDLLHLDKKWIKRAQQVRRQKIESQQDLLINMRPEFVTALQNSLAFSTEKGRAAFLIKNSSKRKRKLNEMEDLKQEEEEFKKDKGGYMSKSKRMKEDLQNLSQKNQELKDYEILINQLHQRGLIDDSGNPIIQ